MTTQLNPRVAVVIEDDEDIRSLVAAILEQSGFDVTTAGTGLEGIEAVREQRPIVTTLDVSMPGMDGFAVARRLREFSDTFIIMLTGQGDEIDVVQGLEAGADDYLTKPFRPRELRARIDAMLRRMRPRRLESGLLESGHRESGLLETGPAQPFSIDTGTRVVQVNGEALDLTRSEFDLLSALHDSGPRVRTKAELVVILRRDDEHDAYVTTADERALGVHVANLRRKLSEAGFTREIETVRGVGFRMA